MVYPPKHAKHAMPKTLRFFTKAIGPEAPVRACRLALAATSVLFSTEFVIFAESCMLRKCSSSGTEKKGSEVVLHLLHFPSSERIHARLLRSNEQRLTLLSRPCGAGFSGHI